MSIASRLEAIASSLEAFLPFPCDPTRPFATSSVLSHPQVLQGWLLTMGGHWTPDTEALAVKQALSVGALEVCLCFFVGKPEYKTINKGHRGCGIHSQENNIHVASCNRKNILFNNN